ncbi:MAG TPA: TolC family protein, partial [Gemmatimonadaceae bacterium]
ARVGPAGARPDPMLMAGVQSVPITDPGFSDGMTMKMVGLQQTIPYPGKLRLRTRAALAVVDAARAELDAARSAVVRDVRAAYFEIAFLDRALANVERARSTLATLVPVAVAGYAAGTGAQGDVLAARTAAGQLAGEATALLEARRAAVARLNAALDRASDTPVIGAALPPRLLRAAAGDPATPARFVSAVLGARLAGSPFPPLDSLQGLAARLNPMLRAHEAGIVAQDANVALARRERLPDVDVAVEYGQRDGMRDLVTATLSVPLPLQHARKQDALTLAATADLRALHAEHEAEVNRLRSEVARLLGAAERDRAQLALYTRSIIPSARAALASATAQYQASRGELGALLQSQAALYEHETQYDRLLTDFATTVAELEQVVGTEVLP